MNASRPALSALALPLNAGAYLLWASATLLFKRLDHLPLGQVFAHRVLWSLVFCFVILAATGRMTELGGALRSRRQLMLLVPTSLLIASNWLLVIWAVGTGNLLDASLGYYLAPLCSVLLAKGWLRESWRPNEPAYLGLSAVGVGLIFVAAGPDGVPWLGLVIAFTFALYSALKKIGDVPPLAGLTLETAIAAVPAALYVVAGVLGGGDWLPAAVPERALLVAIGLVTTLPMLFYVVSVRFLSLTLVGYLQFLNPTLMFLFAVVLFNEPLDGIRLAGFALIWATVLHRFLVDWRGGRGLARAEEDVSSQTCNHRQGDTREDMARRCSS